MTTQTRPINPLETTAEHRRSAHMKARTRAWVAIAMMVTWGVALFSGFLLYLAPAGPRSGQLVQLWISKSQWGDVHLWISVVATVITVFHIIIDWKALRACVRFLGSTERGQAPCE